MVPLLKITPLRTDLQNRIIRRPNNNRVCHRGTFFDNSHSPFIILDENLDIVDINQIALLLIFKEKEAVIGKNLTAIFPGSIEGKRVKLYKEVIRTGKGINIDHLNLKAKNFNYIVSLRVFKIDEGLGISIQETTELVNAIDQLEKTKSKLQQMNHSLSVRNDELEEFSYVAAHDLKAPLTNVATLLELLKDDSKMNLADHAIFKKLESVSKLMCERINALNQVIALKSNLGKNPKEHKFSDIVEKIEKEIPEYLTNSQVQIKTDFKNCKSINIDELQIHSILQNMIINALKFRHPERTPIIKIKTRPKNGKVELTVKDNGMGFDDSHCEGKVFNLFKRMHTHVKGNGVGLYIVKSIAQSRGGYVQVSSTINKGTKFKIVL